MKINHLTINNIKFHKNLDINFSKNNCLIYGENGTGKSSIYSALYSVFKIYFRNKNFDFSKYKNNSTDEDIYIKVNLDNEELVLPNSNYNLPDSIDRDNYKTIYFANQDLLESIISHSDNFYINLYDNLKKYSSDLSSYCEKFDQINNTITSENYSTHNELRKENIESFEEYLAHLKSLSNSIIKDNLKENFEIDFEYEWGISDTLNDYKYPTPEVKLRIDNRDNLKTNFNEAKLKLVSISIYFAIIMFQEEDSNSIKLLVLDDFLTSLDMANRKYIMEYIFENFSNYQKIILTHNLQFYNLIIRALKNRKEYDTDWEIKNIFISNYLSPPESKIVSKNENYIIKAEEKLLEGEYHICGNYLRKEFERITSEFEQKLELGKASELQVIIDSIKSSDDDYYYIKPYEYFKCLKKLFKDFKEVINNGDSDPIKVSKCRTLIGGFSQTLIDYERELEKLKEVINKIEFYKNIAFNPSSHSDEEIEFYRKELEDSKALLISLNDIFDSI